MAVTNVNWKGQRFGLINSSGSLAGQEAKARRAPGVHVPQAGGCSPSSGLCWPGSRQASCAAGGSSLVFTAEAVALSSPGLGVRPFLISPRPQQHSLEEV